MDAMYKSLKSEGVLFLQTHQTFLIHGYPSDYFRFTTEALSVTQQTLDFMFCNRL